MSLTQEKASSILLESKKISSKLSNLHWFILVIALLSTCIVDGYSLYFAILALAIEIYIFCMSYIANKKKSLGVKYLRYNTLTDALSFENRVYVSHIEAELNERDLQNRPNYSEVNYFSTEIGEGYERLNAHLSENCFYTHCLYSRCSSKLKKHIGIYAIIYLCLVLYFIINPSSFDVDTLAKLAILIISANPLKNLINDYIHYSNASNELLKLDQELGENYTDFKSLLLIYSDYIVITSGAPLIPESIMNSNKDRISEIFSERNCQER